MNLLLLVTTLSSATEKVLCFGDSITQGTMINGRYKTGTSWVNLLEDRSGGTLKCINAGRSGRQTKQHSEIDAVLLQNKKIDRVIFFLGINDIHFGKEQNEKNLVDCVKNMDIMVKKARVAYGPNVKITILGSPGINTKTVSPHFRGIGFDENCAEITPRLATAYQAYAVKNGCQFIDLAGVISPQNYGDGLHPDTAGQQQIADYVWSCLVNNKNEVKIACVGDSITFGSGIQNRHNNSYPAQLQSFLPKNYQVSNYGLSGRTLLKKGDRPYWREKAYKNVLDLQPNYVIIKLGTNDSKPKNWAHKTEFEQNLKEFAQSFLKLKSRPKVILATPAPVTRSWANSINDETVLEIAQTIRKVADELKLGVIDFNVGIPRDSKLFPDGVHPNKNGATIMAQIAYSHLLDRQFSHSGVELPAIFSDDMVLQRDKPIRLWGKAQKNSELKVKLAGTTTTINVGDDGHWTGELPALPAGGPYLLDISSAQGTTSLRNVMIGEVWVCSGQSNMEWPLEGQHRQFIDGAKEAIATADIPNLRLFHLQRKVSATPEKDCIGSWKTSSPESVRKFSATAFFFGRKLARDLDGVAIGLIMTAWGGTPVEAWMSSDCLTNVPEFAPTVKQVQQIAKDQQNGTGNYSEKLAEWYEKLAKADNPNQSKWFKVQNPQVWSKVNELKNYHGSAKYRREITIPKKWQGKELIVELGQLDEIDITTCNGVKIGHTASWSLERKYNIPKVISTGTNKLTFEINLVNLYGDGGFLAKPENLKVYPKSRANKAIKLTGEWQAKRLLPAAKLPKQPRNPATLGFQTATVLYNGMISPLLPLSIRGAIWYQGESNAWNPELYSRTFPMMVQNWRAKFKQGDFPFYYVQIAPFNYGRGRDGVGIRDVQRKSLAVIPNSGMACIMDKTTLNCIHPPQKTEAGERLALWALAKDYGKKVPFSGPLYKNHKVAGEKIIVNFDYAENGLVGKDLKQFEIAGEDGKFVPAMAKIVGSTVEVSAATVKAPKHVRYCWKNAVIGELWNKEGLPASSFKTN